MSQYNKTVLTHAGLELAKRANAGQAKFGITRAVTSADDWSNKTVQDLEEVTTIPNIMQQGTIMDTDEVESNNSVIGVSLCFTNKNLSTGYQIRIIGLYVKEEGQENDFLYAVTTAITPESMPSFADKVLYKFNMQMYLVIGNAQSVNVVINDGTAVTHGQFNKYKAEVTGNLKKLENTHKEDMSHVAKSASINGGAEVLPDSTGKLNLVVPDPDLSEYVSLEQLTEILQAKADVADVNKQIKAVTDLANTKANTVDVDSKIKTVTDLANTKANSADVYTKTETDNQINKFDLSKVKFRKQYINGDGDKADKTWSATKNEDGTYTIDLYNDDLTAAKLADVIAQLPSKANASDVYTKTEVDSKTSGTIITAYDIASKNPTKVIDSYRNKWLVDQAVLFQFADQINQLKGRRQVDAPDFNNLTDTGTYYVSNPHANAPTGSWGNLFVSNGADHRTSQLYFPDDNSTPWYRTLNEGTWHDWTQLASASQIANVQNTATQANTNANGRLSLGGGNMNLRSTINWNGGNIDDRTGNLGGINWAGASDWAKIYGDQDDNDNLDLAIDLGDDGSNHVSFRKNGSETSAITSDGHFTGTVDWSNVSGRPDVTPIVSGAGGDDLFAFKSNQIRLYPGNGRNCKNLPPASNTQWFTVQYIFENPNVDGVAIFRSPANEVWTIGNNGGVYTTHWVKLANSNDISDLQNQIQQLRDNQFEVQTFTDATAAANWEAQKPGKRMAIVNS